MKIGDTNLRRYQELSKNVEKALSLVHQTTLFGIEIVDTKAEETMKKHCFATPKHLELLCVPESRPAKIQRILPICFSEISGVNECSSDAQGFAQLLDDELLDEEA